MNVLDILLLLAAVWFAIIGYRQGFVVGILSVIGFLGGGLVAMSLIPLIWDRVTDNGTQVSTTVVVIVVVVIIVCASIGQALTTHLGAGSAATSPGHRRGCWTRPAAPWSTSSRCCWWPG